MNDELLKVAERMINLIDQVHNIGYNEGCASAGLSYDDVLKQVKKDAYNNGYEDRGNNLQEMFDKGLQAAWECAKKIATIYKTVGLVKVFNERDLEDLFNNYSPSEAIAKIKEYEGGQNASTDKPKLRDCTGCKYNTELPHAVCKSCISGDRYVEDKVENRCATCVYRHRDRTYCNDCNNYSKYCDLTM